MRLLPSIGNYTLHIPKLRISSNMLSSAYSRGWAKIASWFMPLDSPDDTGGFQPPCGNNFSKRPQVANWQLIRVEKGGYLQVLRFLFQAATPMGKRPLYLPDCCPEPLAPWFLASHKHDRLEKLLARRSLKGKYLAQTLPQMGYVVRLLGHCRYVFAHAHRRVSLARTRDH
jgi:hypothetical protein